MNITHKSPIRIAAAAAIALTLAGCSFSTSSKSSSTSSTSPFKLASSPLDSSSESSKTQEEKYERDVTEYTVEFVQSSRGDLNGFRSRLGELARSHGITDWESDDLTYVAIGRGLRQADLGKPQYQAFKESMSRSDARRMRAVQRGYDD